MSEWTATTTAELINSGVLEIGDGYRAKNSELSDAGLPFARAQNVNGGFAFDGADRFPEAALPRVGRKVSRPGDSVITTKGSVGRVAFVTTNVEQFVFSPQLSYWRSLDHDALDPRFVRYWLQAPEFLHQCAAVKGSTDMADYVNLRDQRRLRITLPTPPEQRQIGDVLGAIDDLIENNRRRIALLEQMAQAIYREWFVHFRYPGHEHDELVDSPLGPIPVGWGIRRAGELMSLDKGVSYKGSLLDDDGVPMVNLKCFGRDGSFRFDALKGYSGPTKPQHRVRAGDLVMANTDLTQAGMIVGRVAIVPRVTDVDQLLTSHHVFAIRPRTWSPVFFMHALSEGRFREYARGTASGTTVLGLRRDDVLAYPMLEPPLGLVERFQELATEVEMLVNTLSEGNRRLSSVRDLLLPKLVTGAIDVSSLDLDAALDEEAAA